MEYDTIVMINRNNKNIALYIKDSFFSGISQLLIESISDVEIYPLDQEKH